MVRPIAWSDDLACRARTGPRSCSLRGAWLGGWACGDVGRRLRVAGREVHPATLSGLGDRVHLARPELDLDVHIADVVGLLDAEQLEQAVLVRHSYARTVITAVADGGPRGSTPSSGSIAHPLRTGRRSSNADHLWAVGGGCGQRPVGWATD